MKTMNLTPNVDGLVRYLRALALENRTKALSLVEAGWNLPPLDAAPLLDGVIELDEAVRRFESRKGAAR